MDGHHRPHPGGGAVAAAELIRHLEGDVGTHRRAAEFLRLEQIEEVRVPQVADGLVGNPPLLGGLQRPLAQARNQLGGALGQSLERK
jgi:hypothetical protein